MQRKRKCKDCKKWMENACPYLSQAREGTIRRDDLACEGFESDSEDIKVIPEPTVLTDKFLAEQVWDRKNQPKYCVYSFDEDCLDEETSLKLGELDEKNREIVYTPVDNLSLRKGLIIVPQKPKETTFKEVLEQSDDFALKCYDPCGQLATVRFLVRVAVGSWFLDRFVEDPVFDIAGAGKFAPIIPIRGASQSGKNRFAFVLRLLSYRPYFEMSTYRIPSLYRPLDLWQGTLVLDEADFANTTEKSELIHFLNCRATGTPISRQDPKNPKKTDTFSNFGDTVLTQRKGFDDNATESRCLPFYSEKTEKQLPTVETDEMLKEGLELQNKLLYLRMKFFRKVVIDKTAWVEELTDHRLIASLLPLIALSKHEPVIYEAIVQTTKEIEKLKVEEKANSEDGIIVNMLWEKIKDGLFECWNNPHYYVLDSIEIEETEGKERAQRNLLTTSLIGQELKWSTRHVRKVLNSIDIASKGLPNAIKVGNKTWRCIFFRPEKLEKRLFDFVVDYKPKQLFEKLAVTQVTQVTSTLCGEKSKEEKLSRVSGVTSVTSVTDSMERSFLNRVHSCNFLIVSEKGTCGCCQKETTLTHSVLLFPDKHSQSNALIKVLCCSECAQVIELYLRGQEE